MSKTRSIRPSFWEDDKIGALPREARLLFVGVWSLADDEGRLVWDAAVVRESIFPGDGDLSDEVVAGWMGALAESGLVRVYAVGMSGRRFAAVTNWARHQRITRPKASLLPAPHECTLVGVDAGQGGNVTTPVLPHGEVTEGSTAGLSESGTAGLTEVSVFIPEPSPPERKGKERKGTWNMELGKEGNYPAIVHIDDAESGFMPDTQEIMSEPASQPPTPPASSDEGNGLGGASADDESVGATQHMTDASDGDNDVRSEEDDMGFYDEPVDPFAPVLPPVVRKPDREAPAGGEDAQIVLPLDVAAPATTVAAEAVAATEPKAKVKRKPRKKASDAEQPAMYPPEVDQLCEHLATLARRNLTTYVSERRAGNVTVSETSRDAADKMLRLDGFTYEQVLALIDWTAQDEFWRTNILSVANLRDKVDRLAMDARFLNWARANARPTKAAANGARLPVTGGARSRTRAVDQVVSQDELVAKW